MCSDLALGAIVNIHDVALAQAYCGRVVGIRDGRVVFDGAPAELDDTALTTVYGAS